MVRTKIICTLGPASETPTVIRKMMLAGMDVVRLNFSHASQAIHKKRMEVVRELNKKYRRHIRILQDLEGYRIRMGKFKEGKPITLERRKVVYLTQEDIEGEGNLLPFDYHGSLEGIKRGQFIYIDDGRIALKVLEVTPPRIKTRVIVGGVLKERKGVNIPDVPLEFPPLTEKDKKDIQFGIKNKVDFIAQSFVRKAEDILRVKNLVKNSLPHCLIIAKIENREGIENIEEILEVSDGIMVARGDMGISLPLYQIPIIQKEIIRKCKERGKFVITATQMLEHMVENPLPTRAEVTDVANAILDGTDYLMLSAETAIGKYPVKAVEMMNKIIQFTEKSSYYREGRKS